MYSTCPRRRIMMAFAAISFFLFVFFLQRGNGFPSTAENDYGASCSYSDDQTEYGINYDSGACAERKSQGTELTQELPGKTEKEG
ncbi:hypothetical protein CPB85DRAFT_1281185, partial [Mucidula mucida]